MSITKQCIYGLIKTNIYNIKHTDNNVLPINLFSKNKKSKDGYNTKCKECEKKIKEYKNNKQNDNKQNNNKQNDIKQNDIKKTILTEDFGKIFEKAICKILNIEYEGKFKYSDDIVNEWCDKLEKLSKIIENEKYKYIHSAKNGSRYDFTSFDNKNFLSAKTNKKNDKICPQVIGQTTKKKFLNYFKLNVDIDIKNYIYNNVKKILYEYEKTTFDYPIIYANQHKNKIILIKKINDINWNDYNISFTKNINNWNESNTIKLNINDKLITIGEFQIHKNRNSIKFRWSINNILNNMKTHFVIENIYN